MSSNLLFSATRRKLHTLFSRQSIIKPSSPIPCHLKTYNLSLIDQFSPPLYMPLVFFYPNSSTSSSSTGHHLSWEKEKASHLKNSLSQTLTQYYPFSGRLVEASSYVDCNGEGIEFVESQVNAPLSEVIRGHISDYQPIDHLFPTNGVWGYAHPNRSLVMVQLSYFSCGGLAIAVSVSHKIGDGSTLISFINHWAAATKRNISTSRAHVPVLAVPHFISYPKIQDHASISTFVLNKSNAIVTKRFVFPSSKINQLKQKAATANSTNPTRYEVVTSLLYGCAVRAANKINITCGDSSYALVQVMNLRKRMVQPLPETTVGNISWDFSIPTTKESELSLNFLTARIRELKAQLTGVTYSQMAQWVTQASNKQTSISSDSAVENYMFSSLCGFPLYQIDFGWGNPIKVSICGLPMKNVFILMDTATGDGIDALVALEQENMEAFQNDEQLLAFAPCTFSAL